MTQLSMYMTLPRCRCMSQQHTRSMQIVQPILETSRESMACMQFDECRCCMNQQDKDCSWTARCRADTSRRRMACMSCQHLRQHGTQQGMNRRSFGHRIQIQVHRERTTSN